MPPETLAAAERRVRIEAALATVLDPELDEALTELGFVDGLEIAHDNVTVTLRLPTYWCSANFAFIMGEDIKTAIGALPFVRSVDVRLIDHFAMDKINRGLADGLSFEEVFDTEAGGGLARIRAEFRDKAYLGRQAAVLQALRRRKTDPATIVAMTIGELARRGNSQQGEHAAQIKRYLEARRDRGEPSGDSDPAFLDLTGKPIPVDGLLDHLRTARRVLGSMEANAEMCRILHAARYGPQAAPFTEPRVRPAPDTAAPLEITDGKC